ncbi:hypothetical protein [Clostridium sp.]|jgi:hypothetical protein|uniref:hypothetical protein n=1 Tax=Clostridium sp. TaxID=1506 RepID=UPI00290CC886|nr:hypothetical protein [Clostridium sp.]MDU7005314.1 hypothetical protein [Clostridium sp.]
MANKELKFSYSNAELYISKYNVYGSRLFLLVDIVNDTMYSGWTASTVATPRYAEYHVLENVTQKEVKRIKAQKEAIGFKELTDDEFKEAIKY